jgi:preprotein translocase subunit SecF
MTSPGTRKTFDFIRMRFATFLVTGVMVVGPLWAVAAGFLNLGIDFRGGYMIEARSSVPFDVTTMRRTLNQLDLGEVSLQGVGGTGHDVMIRVVAPREEVAGSPDVVGAIRKALGDAVSFRRVDRVGPRIGHEIMMDGVQAVVWAILAMMVYVAFRFEWQFGVCAVLSLVHDCLSVVGMYALTGMEFNTTAIVAVLVTAGYSINDTVVIYDRIRENLKKSPQLPLKTVLNNSINETLSRTVLTSSTTLLALAVLFFLGGEVIAACTLPMMCGIAVGTCSSIFLAAPLLLYVGPGRTAMKAG